MDVVELHASRYQSTRRNKIDYSQEVALTLWPQNYIEKMVSFLGWRNLMHLWGSLKPNLNFNTGAKLLNVCASAYRPGVPQPLLMRLFQWRAVNREMHLTKVLGRKDRVLSSKRDIYVNPTTTAQGTFWKMRQNVRAEGWGVVLWYTVSWTWHAYHNHELLAAEIKIFHFYQPTQRRRKKMMLKKET